MNLSKIKEIYSESVMKTYGYQNISFEKGKGCKLWDTEGKEYLDFLSGLAVTNLGHSNEKVIKAVKDQSDKLFHTSNLYYIENQAKLAKLIIDNTNYDKVFFCNSGAEANEAAIKLARKTGKKKYDGKYEIITMKKSFHGRTLATITATGQEKYQKDFTPLPEGFVYAEFGSIQSIKEKINDRTLAIMIEIVQGEGGVNTAPKEFWEELQKLVDDKGLLLIIDEVQTGCGRTGYFLSQEKFNLRPHMTTMAKALGNGLPIGALLVKDEVNTFVPGDHASTFGGNFLSTAAAIAVLEQIFEEGFLEGVRKNSNYFIEELTKIKEKYEEIELVRGSGFLIGVKMEENVIPIVVSELLKNGVVAGSAGGVVVRFAPPLNVSKDEINQVLIVFEKIIKEL